MRKVTHFKREEEMYKGEKHAGEEKGDEKRRSGGIWSNECGEACWSLAGRQARDRVLSLQSHTLLL